MAVFGHQALGNNSLAGGGVLLLGIIIVAIKENDDVRILLNSARITKIGQHRPLIAPRFVASRKL